MNNTKFSKNPKKEKKRKINFLTQNFFDNFPRKKKNKKWEKNFQKQQFTFNKKIKNTNVEKRKKIKGLEKEKENQKTE